MVTDIGPYLTPIIVRIKDGRTLNQIPFPSNKFIYFSIFTLFTILLSTQLTHKIVVLSGFRETLLINHTRSLFEK